MRWLKRLGLAVLILAAIAAVLVLEGGTLRSVFRVGDLPKIDFAALERTPKPNQYLVCPPGLCKTALDGESPFFEVPVERLQTAWQEIVAVEPRVERVTADEQRHLYDYVQRTRFMRYPDIITVQFLATADGRSTLAIYSRSIYGRSDFGVNKARITDWLAKLRTKLAA